MGRWWQWREKDRRCGQVRSSRTWQATGKKKLETGRKWWERGSWRRAKQLRPGRPAPPPLPFSPPSCPSAAGVFLCASSSHRCGQTCGRRSRRRRVSPRCECGCELSGGRCGWSCACRCDTGKVSGPCGCECGASVRLSAKSADRTSPRGKRRASREEGSCLAGWGTYACGWVWSAGIGRHSLGPGNQSVWQRPWWWTKEWGRAGLFDSGKASGQAGQDWSLPAAEGKDSRESWAQESWCCRSCHWGRLEEGTEPLRRRWERPGPDLGRCQSSGSNMSGRQSRWGWARCGGWRS